MGYFSHDLQPALQNSSNRYDESQELVESEYMNTELLRDRRPRSKLTKSGHQSAASNGSRNLQEDPGFVSRDGLQSPYENEAFLEKCRIYPLRPQPPADRTQESRQHPAVEDRPRKERIPGNCEDPKLPGERPVQEEPGDLPKETKRVHDVHAKERRGSFS